MKHPTDIKIWIFYSLRTVQLKCICSSDEKQIHCEAEWMSVVAFIHGCFSLPCLLVGIWHINFIRKHVIRMSEIEKRSTEIGWSQRQDLKWEVCERMLRKKRRNEKDFGMCTHWICFPWKVVVSKTCPLIFRDHFAEAGIRGSLRASFLSLTSKFLSSCLKPSQFLCLSLLSSPSILSNVIFAIV